jgi:hypothetical protein
VRRRRLPEPFTFFVDECLGAHAVHDALAALLETGERIETRPKGTTDEAWLPEAGERWICLTKDRQLKRRPNEIEAILRVGAGVFILGDASGAEHARRITEALPVLRRVARTHDLAFIARVEPEGKILVLYEAGKKLEPPVRIRPKVKERR